MAKKKEEKDIVVTEEKNTDIFNGENGFGIAILNIIKFALPEITSGSIKINDSYYNAKTDETVIKAEACGAEIDLTLKLGEKKKCVVEITADGTKRKFEYKEEVI